MHSENPTGADNQQGSRPGGLKILRPTPQRLHAELLAVGAMSLEAYLQGALRDGTRCRAHRTHRIGQSDLRWLQVLEAAFARLGARSWIYREGRTRPFWVLETSASFLDIDYDARPLVGSDQGLGYVRGYFDADGGMPTSQSSRLYLQFTQKSRESLEVVALILESWGVHCGRIHNPSAAVDPNYWRVYVRSGSHERFLQLVGSWHPRKRQQIHTRMVR
jgi:LAGLIDADG DNA endonuclease family protein